MMEPMRRTSTLASALLVAALSLTACSSSSGSSSGGSSGGKATTIDITIKGGKVTPSGERVQVGLGKPITLKIDADTSGEIHVHSSPEQEIPFDQGSSTKKLTIQQPGIVDVEDHALNQVIVQLQVS